MNLILESALEYASRGWPVLPLTQDDKRPLPGTHGVKDATTDVATIKKWWADNPDANLGIACGPPGPTVVDVDTHGGDGYASLDERFPGWKGRTYEVATPQGGMHLYFQTDGNLPSRRIAEALELKSYGTYVAAPPSQIGSIPYRVINEAPLAPLPVDLRPPAFAPGSKPAPWGPTTSAAPVQSGNKHSWPTPTGRAPQDIIERAHYYATTMDIAVDGDHGQDRLYRAISTIMWGYNLSDEDTADVIMESFNPRCRPPWNVGDPKEKKELIHKFEDVRKDGPYDGKRPGFLLAENADTSNIEKLVRNILQKVNSQQDVDDDDDEEEQEIPLTVADYTPDEDLIRYLGSPPGVFAKKLCAWINGTSMVYQPMMTLPAVLGMLSVLFGHKITDRKDSRTNLYILGIAPSGAGKNYAPNVIRKLMLKVRRHSLLGGFKIASDSAIEKDLSENPCLLYLLDEIGHFFNNAKTGASYSREIVPTLMRLYSSSGSVYRGTSYSTRDSVTLVEPCCTIYGTTTPSRFTGGFDISELEDGWLARCLVMISGEGTTMPVEHSEIPDDIINDLREIIENIDHTDGPVKLSDIALISGSMSSAIPIPKRTIVAETEGATRIFDELRDEQKSQENHASLWNRAEENARKIAMILAYADNQKAPVISDETAKYSVRLVRFCLESFIKYCSPSFTEGQYASHKNRVLNIIDKAGTRGTTASKIGRVLSNSTRKYRNELLADLEEMGAIVSHKVGRWMHYWTTHNFKKTDIYLKLKEAANATASAPSPAAPGPVPQPQPPTG